MALDSTVTRIVYAGNNSAVTKYPVPFRYLAPSDVHVVKIAAGTGTVTVVDGVATFTDAQAGLNVGDRVRIGSTLYKVHARTSDTVFSFTLPVDISATGFWLFDGGDELDPGEFTLDVSGVNTAVAIATTAIVRIYRRTPMVQLTTLPTNGGLPSAALELIADRLMMIAQELADDVAEMGVGPSSGPSSGGGLVPFSLITGDPNKPPVYVVATSAVTLSGEQTIDGFMTSASLVLLTAQGDATTNGFWITGASGWSRPDWFAAASTHERGAITQAVNGTANKGVWYASGSFIVDTDAQSWTQLAAPTGFGDVFGPAGATAFRRPLFADATGKVLTDGAGTNPSASPTLDAGTITNTTPRPEIVQQVWNNAALVAALMSLRATDSNSHADSTLIDWKLSGSDRGKLNKRGQWRMLDGQTDYPTYAFETNVGTGMWRDTGSGDLCFSVDNVEVGCFSFAGQFQALQGLLVQVGAVDKFAVGATNAQFAVNVIADFDATRDLGTSSIRWRNGYFSGTLTTTFIKMAAAAPTVASAGTIAPAKMVSFVSGTAAIATITPPTEIAATGGRITLIPTGLFTWTTAGNIAVLGSAVVSRALDLIWDAGTSKWYPSYV